MKRAARGMAMVLAALAFAATAANGPIAFDWHPGGYLYVLLKDGTVSILDVATKRKVATIPSSFGRVPAEIFAARLNGRDYVFVSGFFGRSGGVWQYTAEGRPYARFETPEQAASFDVDPARHLLYVASPVTNVVYSIPLDVTGSTPKRVAYIREAEAVGPIVFDPGRNRVMVGDSGRGVLYDVNPATGAYQKIAAAVGRPISLGIDESLRTLLVADSKGGLVHVFRLENGAFRSAGSIPTGLQNLAAVASGPDDTVFVADGFAAYQLSLKTKKLSRFGF